MPELEQSVGGARARQVGKVDQAGAYPGFSSMKGLIIFQFPPGWDANRRRLTSSIKFAGTHIYTWVERGTVISISHCVIPAALFCSN